MPIGKFLYFGDFVAIPVAVLLFAGLALADRGLAAAPTWAISLLSGSRSGRWSNISFTASPTTTRRS